MIVKAINIFTSLRLTVLLLFLAGVLVFIGTLAQVKLGLYIVQAEYFQNFFIWWNSKNGGISLPVFPGGYLLGSLLLINLLAAHIKRFDFSKKKMGITITHSGLILLLVGQLITELYQVESAMRIPEGESKNYSESPRLSELAIIDISDEKVDKVVSFPTHILGQQKELTHPELPFKLIVKDYSQNSEPRLSRDASGMGTIVFNKTERAVKMDDRDIPYAQVEVATDEGTKGAYYVSNWLSEPPLIDSIRRNFDRPLSTGSDSSESDTQSGGLDPNFANTPTFNYKGREYKMMIRPIRFYKPYSIEMIDFTHEKDRGTEVAKNFSSRVKINNPQSGENREVLIYMNNPLRYGGETYYQGSFERGDKVSILQVVRNPGWITPYVACTLVGLGLTVQFMSHLIQFIRKKKHEKQ